MTQINVNRHIINLFEVNGRWQAIVTEHGSLAGVTSEDTFAGALNKAHRIIESATS